MTEEPGGLQATGSQRTGHDWSDLAAAALIIFLKKHQFFSAQLSFQLTSIHDHWKNQSLDYMDHCWQSNVSAFFFFTLLYFTILYWFCHTLTWIHHGCTCVPKHEPPSHLPPHNISLGHPRAPAPSMLYPASDIDWWFNSYMIVYMFQQPKTCGTL